MNQIGILGAGTWGAALARLLANKGFSVTVWSAEPEKAAELARTGKHPKLPNMQIPDSIRFTDRMEYACATADVIVFAVSSVYMRSTARLAGSYVRNDQLLVSVAKGIEAATLLTMTDVLESELGNADRIVALSGPTHAEEVSIDLPTMIVSACPNENAAKAIQDLFSTDTMRVYTNTDILGVELSGALKNIMALAAGVSEGLGYGDNAKAALITRGIAEMSRLGEAMGCNPQTFSGLAGIGDLVVTAMSRHSRNNRAGFLLGTGYSADKAAEEVGMVVEGFNALDGALALSAKYNVEMPIVNAMNDIVNHGADPREVVSSLMLRQRKSEFTSV